MDFWRLKFYMAIPSYRYTTAQNACSNFCNMQNLVNMTSSAATIQLHTYIANSCTQLEYLYKATEI